MRRLGQLVGWFLGIGRHGRSTRRATPKPKRRKPEEEEIDMAMRESFPASDPPALSLEERERRS
jgi:hypothetical protein